MIGFWEWMGEAWRHWRHGLEGWHWVHASPLGMPGGYRAWECSKCHYIQVR